MENRHNKIQRPLRDTLHQSRPWSKLAEKVVPGPEWEYRVFTCLSFRTPYRRLPTLSTKTTMGQGDLGERLTTEQKGQLSPLHTHRSPSLGDICTIRLPIHNEMGVTSKWNVSFCRHRLTTPVAVFRRRYTLPYGTR